MKMDYLLSFIFFFLLIAAFLFGGIIWVILILVFYAAILYVIFKISRMFKGDTVLNFFGILYIISAAYDFLVLSMLGMLGEMPFLAVTLFILLIGVILKFFQSRWVVTAALAVHTVLLVAFTYLDVISGDVTISPFMAIFVNIALIIYVNVLKEMVRDEDYPPRTAPRPRPQL